MRVRCFWFDEKGDDRLGKNGQWGCPRGRNCNYVHPKDVDWEEAVSRNPPQGLIVEPGSPRKRSFHGRSPTRESAQRGRFTGDDGHTRFRDHSPISPTSKPRSSYKTRDDHRARSPTRTTTPPPRRSIPPPLPPPLPRSTTPSVSTGSVPPQPQMTKEQRTSTWVDRIKTLTEAVIARSKHVQLERDLQNLTRLSRSDRYESMCPDDKENLSSHLHSLEQQTEAKKLELNTLVFKLVDTNFWPAISADAIRDEVSQGMESSLGPLQTKMQELYQIVDAVQSKVNSASLADENSERPLKRRRLSTDTLVNPLDSAKEFGEIGDKLKSLDSRLSEVEGQAATHEEEILDHVKANFDELKASLPDHSAQVSNLAGQVEVVEQNMNKTESDLTEVISEVAELITRANKAEALATELKNENEVMREDIRQMLQVQKESKEEIEKNRAETAALNAALSAYISQPPRTSTSTVPPLDELVTALRPDILQTVRKDIEPMLLDVRESIEKMLRNHTFEMGEDVLKKISLTMRTVEMMSTWIEKCKAGGVPIQTNSISHANGQDPPSNSHPPA